MRRTRAIQIRVSDEEYEELASKAGAAGMSRAEFLRERAGLNVGVGAEGSAQPSGSEGLAEMAIPETKTVSTDSGVDTRRLKQLAAQLQNRGMSPVQAQREALRRMEEG